MARYTMELCKLVGTGYNVFDDTWNTFVPEHKDILCDKILRRYWFNEIGAETADRFKHYLNEHLARIMPFYNQMYASELLEIVPLYNYWLESEGSQDRNFGSNRNKVNRNDLTSIRQMAQSIESMSKLVGSMNGVMNGNVTETWNEDKTGKENELTHTDETTTTTYNEDTTGKQITDKTQKLDGSETGKEVMEDTSSGTKDVNTTASGTTSNIRLYSDTPQAIINEQGMQIEQTYLTNYTRDNGSTSSTGTEKDVISNTENKTTDTSKNTDNTTTEDSTVDTTGSKNSTTKVEGGIDGTRETTYSEGKDGNKATTSSQTDKKDQTTNDSTHEFSNGSTTDTTSSVTGENETLNDKEDKQEKGAVKGFVVSQSQLLEEYRKTFLNIDEQIIQAIANNFMGVF